MELPTIIYKNKIYTLKPKFIANLQERFRIFKLKLYKKKKVNEEKTSYKRFYHMKFNVRIVDDCNPQVIASDYEIVVPAIGAFFAKKMLNKNIKSKIFVDVIDVNEMTVEEHEQYLENQKEFVDNQVVSKE